MKKNFFLGLVAVMMATGCCNNCCSKCGRGATPATGVGQTTGPAATSTVGGRMMQASQQPTSSTVLGNQQTTPQNNGTIMPTSMSAKQTGADSMSR